MKNVNTTVFGEVVRKLRKEKGLTQQELEKKTGINRAYIAQIETGKIKNTSIATLNRLAHGLEVEQSELLKATEEADNNSSQVFVFTQKRDSKDMTPEETKEADKSESDFLKRVYELSKTNRQNGQKQQ